MFDCLERDLTMTTLHIGYDEALDPQHVRSLIMGLKNHMRKELEGVPALAKHWSLREVSDGYVVTVWASVLVRQ